MIASHYATTSDLHNFIHKLVELWAPAPGGQGRHVPTLEIIWLGIAHPLFLFLVIV